jgi:hypothetical protein
MTDFYPVESLGIGDSFSTDGMDRKLWTIKRNGWPVRVFVGGICSPLRDERRIVWKPVQVREVVWLFRIVE